MVSGIFHSITKNKTITMATQLSKKDIWNMTVKLLNDNGCTTRGETKKETEKKKGQLFFERRLLVNPVGQGRHR
jgi:hypothetical protein